MCFITVNVMSLSLLGGNIGGEGEAVGKGERANICTWIRPF